MKFLRLLLIALLTFTVPATGMASAGMSMPCHDGSMEAKSGDADCCARKVPTDCPDHRNQPGHDHEKCKPGSACNSCLQATGAPAPAPLLLSVTGQIAVVSRAAPIPSSHSPHGLWRPPRSV